MAQFNLENELQHSLKLDTPLTRGPVPRWERKATEFSTPALSASLNCSANSSVLCSSMNKISSAKTPSKTPKKNTGDKIKRITPSRNKTPKTPGGGGDRFIPNRSAMQFDLAKYVLSQPGEDNENLSPNTSRYRTVMSENLNGNLSKFRIMAYQKKAPLAPIGQSSEMKILYSSSKNPSVKKNRHIPSNPEQILDAPEIVDDYYLNLIDWSSTNSLAVALAGNVYIWNAATSDIQLLLQLPQTDQYITSISWVKDANCLAVGTSTAEVQIWDVEAEKRLRLMKSHISRVPSLAWNSFILSTGGRNGHIHHHDVRKPRHHVGTYSGHSLEVCGLQWSPDGRFLASGGNDNILNIWDSEITRNQAQPLHTMNNHEAAVKAVSWCPWQNSLLATGGGTSDRHIRFWNCNTGTCLNAVDTKSQVCGILWSSEYREIISGHGFVNNELIIWKYPQLTKVAELTGHTARILSLSMSPDGSTVASAGADETLRLWRCFSVDPKKKKIATKKDIHMTQGSLLRGGIR